MKLLISVYLWIHNEYHRGSSVDIGGNEMVFHGVSSMEVNFDELSVAVCAIHNTPVYALYKEGKIKAVGIFIKNILSIINEM